MTPPTIEERIAFWVNWGIIIAFGPSVVRDLTAIFERMP